MTACFEDDDRFDDDDHHDPDDDGGGYDSCDECALYGDYQCSRHGDEVIAHARSLDEHRQLVEALDTIAAQSKHWTDPRFLALSEAALTVQMALDGPGPAPADCPAPQEGSEADDIPF